MGLWEDAPTRMKAFPPAKTLDEANQQIKELQNLVAIAFKNIENIVNGNIDSRNTREIGGWRVDLTDLESKEGDVGMSTEDTPDDDVRFWAGSVDKNTAPWRVYESGKMFATGAVIESSSGYPKVIMDPENQLFGAYASATRYINIVSYDNDSGSPTINWRDGSLYSSAFMESGKYELNSGGDFQLGAVGNMNVLVGGDIELQPVSGMVTVPNWSTVYSNLQNQTLQAALNAKATSGSSTGSGGGATLNGGITPGTQLLVAGGGSVTWTGINVPSHSHTQT